MILDIGVGFGTEHNLETGEYPFRPNAVGINTIFVDLEPPRKWWMKHVGEWILGSAELLPFRNSVFTTIYASHLIEHLSNPETFISEIYRISKNGGEVHIKTPNFLSQNAKRDQTHINIFNVLSLSKLLRQCRFKVYYPSINICLPKPLYKMLKIMFFIFCDELYLVGRKQS